MSHVDVPQKPNLAVASFIDVQKHREVPGHTRDTRDTRITQTNTSLSVKRHQPIGTVTNQEQDAPADRYKHVAVHHGAAGWVDRQGLVHAPCRCTHSTMGPRAWVQRQGFVHARRVIHRSSAMGPRTFPFKPPPL